MSLEFNACCNLGKLRRQFEHGRFRKRLWDTLLCGDGWRMNDGQSIRDNSFLYVLSISEEDGASVRCRSWKMPPLTLRHFISCCFSRCTCTGLWWICRQNKSATLWQKLPTHELSDVLQKYLSARPKKLLNNSYELMYISNNWSFSCFF